MDTVVMVVFSYYPNDPRVRREAEALQAIGMRVGVFCLRAQSEQQQENVRGVDVYRFNVNRSRGGKLSYLFEYGLFFLQAFYRLTCRCVRERVDVVHVHNMPDFLVFSAMIPRFLGAKVILDLHDPTPEVYMTKYDIGYGNPAIRILTTVERMSIRFAHAVLTPNRAFRELFIQRGSPPDKIHIVMNSPQEDIFQPADTHPEGRNDGFVIMYHGTIAERNGLGFALDAIDRLRATIEKLQFVVYGEGDYLDRFLAKVEALKLSDCVSYRGHVPLETIAREIPRADIGLIPNIRSPFTELNLPTRIFEYLAVGRPVIAPRTKGILDYFDDKSLFLFEPGEVESLVECISAVYSDHKRLEQVYLAGEKIYQNYRWELQSKHFTKIVQNVLAG